MGIAIIIPGVDFSDVNLGQVTIAGDIPLVSLAIVGDNAVTNSATFSASYTPANTTERSVAWSVVSGSAYATINSSTGELTALPGANGSSVTIRVTSTDNPTIYAEKTITVTSTSWYTRKGGLVSDGVANVNTLYMVKETSVLDVDYMINELPAIGATAQYATVFNAFESESKPLTRHLILIRSATPKQVLQFGQPAGNSAQGTITYQSSSLPSTQRRIKEQLSATGFTCDDVIEYYQTPTTGVFSAPTMPLRTMQLTKMTMYEFKISEESTVVMDLVPAILTANITADMASDNQVHASGECGLVDLIGNKFYPNVEGSGSFTVID